MGCRVVRVMPLRKEVGTYESGGVTEVHSRHHVPFGHTRGLPVRGSSHVWQASGPCAFGVSSLGFRVQGLKIRS